MLSTLSASPVLHGRGTVHRHYYKPKIITFVTTIKNLFQQNREKGIKSATVVRAIGKTSTDSTVVTLRNCQIGLGTAIAQNIVVRLMPCKE